MPVNGIILVADLTNKESFDNIKIWLKDVNGILDNPCIVLFGNKVDLPKDNIKLLQKKLKNMLMKIN